MADLSASLRETVEIACADAFEGAGFERRFGAVRASDRPDMADYQCNGAMAVAKAQRMNPMQAAEAVAERLAGHDLFTVEIAKPGFLNFRATPAALSALIDAVGADERRLIPTDSAACKTLVDYGGPNLAKEMHVGHLRSAIVGQALYDILDFCGHDVVGDVHLGDWGLQMGQLIAQIEDVRPALMTDPEGGFGMDDLQEWYPAASARSKEDEAFRDRARAATAALQAGREDYMALWRQIAEVSKAALKRDYDRLGVTFDQWHGESRYQSMLDGIVARLSAEGVAVEDDGAVVVPLPDEPKLPPLILRNSNGGYGYGATDLATIADRRAEDDPDLILYVVDARQKTHFRQVFGAAARAGLTEGTRLEHIAFGTVNGKDGKPFKTRAGGVMRLRDLIDDMTAAARKRLDEAGAVDEDARDETAADVALAAIRFGELSHDRESAYVFDPEQFLQFEGKTGPYIQYTCVRVRSLMARAAAEGLTPGAAVVAGDAGRDLALCLDEAPAAFARAVETRKPNLVANHMYKLANRINTFYHAHRVLGGDATATEAAAHLGALAAASAQLELCARLLGLPIPRAM